MIPSKTRSKNIAYFYSLAIQFLVLLFFYFNFSCTFATNDDYYMKLIASGAFGSPDSHLVYINSVLGYILSWLYTFFSFCSWYELIQYFLIFLSLSSISYVVLNMYKKGKIRMDLSILIILVSAYTLYVDLQYTKTAFILTVSGNLLIVYSIENDAKWTNLALALFLLINGFILRKQQFLASCFLFIPVFIPVFLNYLKDLNNSFYARKFRRLILSALVCLLMLSGLQFLDNRYYSNNEWSFYKEYNSCRTELLDGGFPYYEDNLELYANLGMNEDDYLRYKNWDIDDPELFDIKTMKTLIGAKKKDRIDFGYLLYFASSCLVYFLTKERIMMFSFVLIATIIAYLIGFKKKMQLPFILTLALLFVSVLYCFYIRENNHFVTHVQIGLLLTASYVLLYSQKAEITLKKKSYKDLMIMIAVIGMICLINSKRLRIYADDSAHLSKKEVLAEIEKDHEHLYYRSELNQVYFVTELFELDTFSKSNNLISFGGWLTNSPLLLKQKGYFGINNPSRDIVNNDYVYVISDSALDIEKTLSYINRHYDHSAYSEIVKKIGKYTVYRIVSKD